jgi:hypothetical protein
MLLSVFFGGGDVALGDLKCLLFEWTVSQISKLELVGKGLHEELSFFFFFIIKGEIVLLGNGIDAIISVAVCKLR